MPYYIVLIFLLCTSLAGCAQHSANPKPGNQPVSSDVKVGGGCEGCEAIYESPESFAQLNEVDTLPDFGEAGPKLHITGIIYHPDGKTPAKDVVLYVYHTDQQGKYTARTGGREGWGQRHGYIRGWIKTGNDGTYHLYTLVPASYPNSNNPKHIHPTIKEPGKTEYWIDEFLFADDPLLPEKERTRTQAVGGSGLLTTYVTDGILEAKRDIILGLNVRGYPQK